jgi:micrococcal nuclease
VENNTTFVPVVDGDTLIANIDGKEEYVRLLLVHTPKTKRSEREIQPIWPRSK